MVEFGRPHGFGLEVGSKAELVLAAAALAEVDAAGTLLVCNGYKDAEYMELVCLAMCAYPVFIYSVSPPISSFRQYFRPCAAPSWDPM